MNPYENFISYLYKYLKKFAPEAKNIGFLYDHSYKDLIQHLKLANNTELNIIKYNIDILKLNSGLINSYDFSIIFFDVYKLYQQNTLLDYYKNIIPHLKSVIHKMMFIRDMESSFEQVYYCLPSFIAEQNKELINIAQQSSKICITDNNGSYISAPIERAKWTDLNGFNHQTTLMPSEITTFSESLNGEINFTGSLQSQLPIGIKFGLINEQNKISIKIVNSIVTEISSLNKQLDIELNNYLKHSKANQQVIELGIGTNTGITSLVGRSAPFEERYPGFHLGIGGSIPGSQHIDFVFNNSMIKLDKTTVFSEQKFHI